MFNTSLLDVLKENEKVQLDDSTMVVAIEEAIGFTKHHNNINIFERLKSSPDLTQKQLANIELAEIFMPALARFKPGEVMDYLHADAKAIRDNKEKEGLL